MLYENDIIFLLLKTIIIVVSALGMMSSLTNFKYSARRILEIFVLYMFYVAASTAVLINLFGWIIFLRFAFFTISIPAIAVTYLIAKDSPMQAVFNYTTQIDLMLFMMFSVTLLTRELNASKALDLLLRAAFGVLVVFVEVRFFRKPFLRLTGCLRESWLPMALIPCAFCILTMVSGLYPKHFTQNPSAVVYIYLVMGVMAVVYLVVFQSLLKSYRLLTIQVEKNIMDAQLSAQKEHYEAKLGNERKLLRLKHDMQGHLSTMAVLLMDGKTEETLKYLEKLTELHQSSQVELICENPYLSAIVSIFTEKFKENDILFEYSLRLGETSLPGPSLCLILNNALQNALEAVLKLPETERTISLQAAMQQQQLLIRVSNRFCGILHMENGLPATSKTEPGHGYGLTSIRMAVDQLGGDFYYSAQNSCFKLNIAIPEKP